MEIIQFTTSETFNAIFTIYTHITILVAPLFAAFGLMSHR